MNRINPEPTKTLIGDYAAVKPSGSIISSAADAVSKLAKAAFENPSKVQPTNPQPPTSIGSETYRRGGKKTRTIKHKKRKSQRRQRNSSSSRRRRR